MHFVDCKVLGECTERRFQCMCFETGSALEKRSPVKREEPRSHDPASSPLSSKVSSKSAGGKEPAVDRFPDVSGDENRAFIIT